MLGSDVIKLVQELGFRVLGQGLILMVNRPSPNPGVPQVAVWVSQVQKPIPNRIPSRETQNPQIFPPPFRVSRAPPFWEILGVCHQSASLAQAAEVPASASPGIYLHSQPEPRSVFEVQGFRFYGSGCKHVPPQTNMGPRVAPT